MIIESVFFAMASLVNWLIRSTCGDSIISRVWEVIEKYEKDFSVSSLTDDDLQFLPLDYIVKRMSAQNVALLWHQLPPHYRLDPNLKEKLPCLQHYNTENSRTHYDGPAPSRKDCHNCIFKALEINHTM